MSSKTEKLKSTKRGLFITFEGGEGSGKSTHSKLLHEWLQERKIESILTREPGGTPTAEKLREILLSKNIKLENKSQLMLHFASRIEHVNDVILPALATGKVVICDRFLDSTLAYQHYGHGINKKIILEMHKILLDDIMPNITFLLNISTEDYIRRNESKFDMRDRYESLEIDYHTKVLAGFNDIARHHKSRIKVIEPTGTMQETQTLIIAALSKLLK